MNRHQHPRTRNDHGSATLLTLFMALLLMTALVIATFWSAISIARHKLTAAADLTALSTAQALASGAPNPCTTAARIATIHQATLTTCHLTPTTATIQLTTQIPLPLLTPTLTTTSRAGP